MEVLSHSTPMIKQTIQTFPWRYYLIYPHDQTNNTNTSMEVLYSLYPHDQTNNTNISTEVLSHSTPMIKQTIQTFPWRYYLIVPP